MLRATCQQCVEVAVNRSSELEPEKVHDMPTDFPDLIPHPVAEQVIQSVADSAPGVMQLATVVQMPSGVETMPVVSSAPASGSLIRPTAASSRRG
jgi:hypothetical protein